MNYKLKMLAKRGNRSNLRIVLLQRKPQIKILFFIYLSVKWSRHSRENLEHLYEKLKTRFLASQQTDALQI